MEIAVTHRNSATGPRHRHAAHRCPSCRTAALILDHRHVSPPRLGDPLVTEYYDCDYCDSRFTYSPADNRWKPIYQ